MALVQDIYVDVCLPRPHADEIAQLARVSQGGVLGAANRLGQQSEAGCLCRAAPAAASVCTMWGFTLARCLSCACCASGGHTGLCACYATVLGSMHGPADMQGAQIEAARAGLDSAI